MSAFYLSFPLFAICTSKDIAFKENKIHFELNLSEKIITQCNIFKKRPEAQMADYLDCISKELLRYLSAFQSEG